MTDYPRDRIAKSLQALDWQEATEETEWHDGQVVLVAVPWGPRHDMSKWNYEYQVLHIWQGQDQNGEYCEVMCDGNGWSGRLSDIAWYMEVCND